MTDKELKRLSRQELLEMLLAMSKTEKRLRQRIEQLEAQLQDRSIAIKESGSLAEAALKLNHLFKSADDAARQYAENIKANADRDAQVIIACAQAKAERIVAEAQGVVIPESDKRITLRKILDEVHAEAADGSEIE